MIILKSHNFYSKLFKKTKFRNFWFNHIFIECSNNNNRRLWKGNVRLLYFFFLTQQHFRSSLSNNEWTAQSTTRKLLGIRILQALLYCITNVSSFFLSVFLSLFSFQKQLTRNLFDSFSLISILLSLLPLWLLLSFL